MLCNIRKPWNINNIFLTLLSPPYPFIKITIAKLQNAFNIYCSALTISQAHLKWQDNNRKLWSMIPINLKWSINASKSKCVWNLEKLNNSYFCFNTHIYPEQRKADLRTFFALWFITKYFSRVEMDNKQCTTDIYFTFETVCTESVRSYCNKRWFLRSILD